jgi:hypothetical protein
VSSTWLSICVDLVEGHCDDLWPRPGRIFAAARSHTFNQLATAIDDAFARWDRNHLHQFHLADGQRVGEPDPEWDDPDDPVLDAGRLTLGRLKAGEQFVYEFDFGDSWLHLCTVAPRRINPDEQLGIVPSGPLPTGAGEPSPTKQGARRVAPGYGARRGYAELTLGRGLTVGRGAVELLMGRAGIHGLAGPGKSRLILPKLTTAGDLPRAPRRPGFVTAGTTAPAGHLRPRRGAGHRGREARGRAAHELRGAVGLQRVRYELVADVLATTARPQARNRACLMLSGCNACEPLKGRFLRIRPVAVCLLQAALPPGAAAPHRMSRRHPLCQPGVMHRLVRNH